MNSGDMKWRITLQAPQKIPDGMGGFDHIYTDIDTIWAKKWTVSSSELSSGMKFEMIRVQKFGIWYRTKILPSWRIKYANQLFNITSIDPDDAREFMYLTCKEVL